MPDDPNIRAPQDRERIDVGQDHELRRWSKTLGVTKERLREAVQAVGDRVERVREHLRKPGTSGRDSDRKGAKRDDER